MNYCDGLLAGGLVTCENLKRCKKVSNAHPCYLGVCVLDLSLGILRIVYLVMAQYDLTRKILPYLDRHLCFPLLLNPSLSKLYKSEEVQSATYELAKTTDLVDFALSLYAQLHPGEAAPPGRQCLHIKNMLDANRTMFRIRCEADENTREYTKINTGGSSSLFCNREPRCRPSSSARQIAESAILERHIWCTCFLHYCVLSKFLTNFSMNSSRWNNWRHSTTLASYNTR